MSIISKKGILQLLRWRAGGDLWNISQKSGYDKHTWGRAETGKQTPRQETFEDMLATLEVSQDSFVITIYGDNAQDVFRLRTHLNHALQVGDMAEVQKLLTILKDLTGLKSDFAKQIYMSKTAAMMEHENLPSDIVLDKVKEAMDITYKNFDYTKPLEQALIFEEPDLVHTIAKVKAKEGNRVAAMEMLRNLIYGVQHMPALDRQKQRLFTNLMLTLAKLLVQEKDYTQALDVCEVGKEHSIEWMQGWLTPDFDFYKAQSLHGLGRTDECLLPLQHAYFGFCTKGEPNKAKYVAETARQEHGMELELYSTDKFNTVFAHKTRYNYGIRGNYKNIGDFIRIRCNQLGISQEELCRGICNKITLQRLMENKHIEENIFTLEAIMQRLGYDPYSFENIFVSDKNFKAMKLRDEIAKLSIAGKHEQALEELEKLEAMKNFTHKRTEILVNKQFIAKTKAAAMKTSEEKKEALLNAIKITIPKFDENKIDRYRLSYVEIILVNMYIACITGENAAEKKALLYGKLLRNISHNYEDEFEQARMYVTIMFNYSTNLGRAGQREKALEVIDAGLKFDQARERLHNLPGLLFNHGYSSYMLDRDTTREKTIAYFALAYYTASIYSDHGMGDYLPIINDTALEWFDIDLT